MISGIVNFVKRKRFKSYSPINVFEEETASGAEYAKICRSLKFPSKGNLLVVGGVNKYSKSGECAVNLAVNFSKAGYKTLLIDFFSLQSKELNNLFKIEDNVGISEYLCNKESSNSNIIETDFSNLYYMAQGDFTVNVGSVLEDGNSLSKISELCQKFDIVVAFVKPLNENSDGYLLKSVAKGYILGLDENYDMEVESYNVSKSLIENNCEVLGVVFANKDK